MHTIVLSGEQSYVSAENIRRLMSNEWNNLPPSLLAAHFRHCLIQPQQPLLADCPAMSAA
jgi:hypothetical protein